MELSWSTLLLEVINFLILVWLLKRFFYQPVRRAISRRQARLEALREEAERLRQEAEAMHARYQARLDEWEAEKNQAREALQAELHAERERLTQALMRNLEEERRKAEVLAAREERERRRHMEREALAAAGRYVSRLLAQLAGPELEQRLLAVLLEELPQLPAARVDALKQALRAGPHPVHISSAYPLTTEQRQALQEALATLLGQDVHAEFEQDPALLAGLRITVGPWVLQANLADELQDFLELAHGA